jgi:hypothetical protein
MPGTSTNVQPFVEGPDPVLAAVVAELAAVVAELAAVVAELAAVVAELAAVVAELAAVVGVDVEPDDPHPAVTSVAAANTAIPATRRRLLVLKISVDLILLT